MMALCPWKEWPVTSKLPWPTSSLRRGKIQFNGHSLEDETVALLETELKFDMNFITTTQATTRKAAERAAATGFPLLKILSFPTCSHFGPVFYGIFG